MLAIVIPYYKLAFFEETIRSLANQTDKRFKVYIGDDASPENPEGLLQKYSGQFDFSYYRFNANMGGDSLVNQWERCIALTQNEPWLMILGDDDYLDQDVIAQWYGKKSLFEGKSQVIRFATKTINQQLQTISDAFLHPQWESSADSWFRRFKEQTRSSLSEHIFRREIFTKKGFRNYPLAWHSDDMAWLDFSDGQQVFSINESLVYIRMSELNISGKRDNKFPKDQATVQFLKEIILEKSRLFSNRQKLEILMAFEVAVKKYRQPNAAEWKMLLAHYVKIFNAAALLKSVRRYFISVIHIQ